MQNSSLTLRVLAALLLSSCVQGQSTAGLEDVTHSSSFRFVERNGICVYGKISKADASSVTVQPYEKPPLTIRKENLLQVSQGNGLLFTARSSWADVCAATLYPHEELVLTFKSGKRVKGKPVKSNADSITVKHGLRMSLYKKSDIATIDYLRVKPATDGFMAILGESPWLLLFDPEFYYRASGFEGRVLVRLYDAAKPEENAAIECKGDIN